jgi:hypothetical protein
MTVDAAKIAQLEQELAEARAQLLMEDGRRFQVIMREISEEEKERILKWAPAASATKAVSGCSGATAKWALCSLG